MKNKVYVEHFGKKKKKKKKRKLKKTKKNTSEGLMSPMLLEPTIFKEIMLSGIHDLENTSRPI